ncbi:hypothetical protein HY947_02305, partial [Candidatus Gottesmanbacteria bacterium]|nr:hypothetical protein [Candidatus Gottesmanbacteria bacterium]
MLLTYSSTPDMIETIDNLMALRQSILLTPLSPRTELRLSFEATVHRIRASLFLSGNETDVRNISETLLARPKKPSRIQLTIIRYK